MTRLGNEGSVIFKKNFDYSVSVNDRSHRARDSHIDQRLIYPLSDPGANERQAIYARLNSRARPIPQKTQTFSPTSRSSLHTVMLQAEQV